LIRDPLSVLGSWMGKSGDVHQNNPHPEEVGIVQLLDVYSKVMGATFNNDGSKAGAIVIDSDDLASQPVKMLQELCASLEIDYRDSMLRWKSGKHECDGPWAKWWYHDVWESSGWDAAIEDDNNNKNGSGVNHPRTKRYRTVPQNLMPVFRLSSPAYEFLKTCTLSYEQRAIAIPPSGKLFEDPRNEHVLVYVGSSCGPGGGRIVPREMARVSPFDSSVQGGDGKRVQTCTIHVYSPSFHSQLIHFHT
jgi:hypothetical protein